MSKIIEVKKMPKIVWQPLPGSQTMAASCPAHIILYHGSRGPGKTDVQLMRFRSRVGIGYGRHWRGVIFDREYKNLDDLVSKSLRWFPEFRDGAKFINSKSDYKWKWPTGEELLFRTVKVDADYWGFHGQEFPFIGWNELTKYPNQNLFEAMMSCNRTSFRPEDFPQYINGETFNRTKKIVFVKRQHPEAQKHLLPQLPLEVFATCNPYGSGHNWVKRYFIDAAPMGLIVKESINVFNPKIGKREDVIKTKVHLFGSYRENKFLTPEYVASLEKIEEPNKRRAWLGGDWDVTSGGMFDDLWLKPVHVVKPFNIPSTWRLTRSFDYGSSKPFSVGWWAISDGSEIKLADGSIRNTLKGDLFRIMEWYGCSGRPNEGLRLLTSQITAGIIERELNAKIYKKVHPGPADNSIFDVMDGNSIADIMSRPVLVNGKHYPGVIWTRCDKSAGSRKAGWEKLRSYLGGAVPPWEDSKTKELRLPRTEPGLFCFENCKDFINLFPTLPRDEDDLDDVDTESEDHIGDEVRYFVMSVGVGAKIGKTKGTQ
jgi:Terminase large subunit, T4likevirus-type, N-terminal